MDIFAGLTLNFIEADRRRVYREWNYRQFNEYAKVYYIGGGEGHIKIMNKDITLRPGRLYLIPPYIPLSMYCEESMFHYWAHFTMDRPGELAFMDIITANWEARPKDSLNYPKIFEAIIKAFETQHPKLQMQAQAYLRLILANFIPDEITDINSEIGQFIPTLHYIEENLDDDLSNEVLAELHNWHPTYFANKFSQTLGTSPRNYVIKKRIETARKILWAGKKSVAETAKEVGFDNQFYFSRVFTKLTGISPGKFKKEKVR